MQLRQEFRTSLAIVVGFQLITAFGMIGLLSRMTPAIADILDENEYTIEAAQQMLLVLARRPFEQDADALGREFQAALDRANDNITEPGEPEVLARLERTYAAALAGDPDALRETVEGIGQLVEINRAAMLRADHEARRLGTAGAWAAVILAVAALAATSLVGRRLAGRILDPLEEIYDVSDAASRGDRFRRCRKLGATAETRRLLESINVILDERLERRPDAGANGDSSREVALHLLDEHSRPTFVVGGDGAVLMANSSGLERLRASDAENLRRDLQAVAAGLPTAGRLDAAAIRNAGLWLCVEP